MTDFNLFLSTLTPPGEQASNEYDTRKKRRARDEAVRIAAMQLPHEATQAIKNINAAKLPTGGAWAAAEMYNAGSRLFIGPTNSGKTIAACRIALRAAWRDFASIRYLVASELSGWKADDYARIGTPRVLIVDEVSLACDLTKAQRAKLYGLIDRQYRARRTLIGCSTKAILNLDIGAERIRRFGKVCKVSRDWA